MPAILAPILPLLYPLLSTALTAIVGWVAKEAVSAINAHQKAKALAFVAQAAAQALEAAIKAAGGTLPPTPATITAAISAAKASIQAQWPDIQASLCQELDVLLPFVIK